MKCATYLCLLLVASTVLSVDAQRTRRPRRTRAPRPTPEPVATDPPVPVPVTSAPASSTPVVPETNTPATNAPDTNTPVVPETSVPETVAPDTDAPVVPTTDVPTVPETDAPATNAPDTNTPVVPETSVPETDAPVVERDFGDSLTLPGQSILESVREQYLDVVEALVAFIESSPSSMRPLLVRLAWHSCGQFNGAAMPIGGTTGGCIRTTPENALPDNAGVDVATEALEPVKAAFPFITYADLYQLAGNTALEYMGSPSLFFRPGRRDFVAPSETDLRCVDEAERMPLKHINNDAFPHLETLDYFFAKFGELGFSLDTDADALFKMVALMGGHQVGAMHLEISNNEGQWTTNNLEFGIEYFFNLENGPWGEGTQESDGTDIQYRGGPRPRFIMLPIDMVMRADRRLRNIVRAFSTDRALYETHFVAAWRQLQENGVDFA